VALKIPTVSELQLEDFLTSVGGTGLQNCKVRLFTNNYTPVDGTVLGDLTEAIFAGYVAQTIANWTTATTVSAKAQTQATVSFLNSSGSPKDVYGYYLTNAGGSVLLGAERFSAPPISIADGNNLVVTVTFTVNSEA